MSSGCERVYPCAMSLDDFASFQPPYESSQLRSYSFESLGLCAWQRFARVCCWRPLSATI
jgi:hypothetical protein